MNRPWSRQSHRPARVPGGQLRHYDRTWLRGDVLAGVTVAAYLVPQVLAYAGVAGLPPVTGLWAAVAALLAYALIGSSRRLSVGPESTTALLTAAALGPIAAGDPRRYAALAATLAALVGLVCLLAWVARLGFLADLLSRPVLVGYMTGIAFLMVSSQLDTAHRPARRVGDFRSEVASFVTHLDEVHWASVAVSAATLAFLFGASKLAPKAPVPLLGVVLAAAAVALLSLGDHGVALVGDSPPDCRQPRPGSDGGPAPARVAGPRALRRRLHRQHAHRSSVRRPAPRGGRRRPGAARPRRPQTLRRPQCTGCPSAAAAAGRRSATPLGARSQVHSLVAASMVLLTLGLLSALVATSRKPALGALVVWAATRLVDVREFRRFARFRRSELFLALTTVAAVLLLDVLTAVLIAVALSVLDLLRRVARPHDGVLG